jgi:hypothetical protein
MAPAVRRVGIGHIYHLVAEHARPTSTLFSCPINAVCIKKACPEVLLLGKENGLTSFKNTTMGKVQSMAIK